MAEQPANDTRRKASLTPIAFRSTAWEAAQSQAVGHAQLAGHRTASFAKTDARDRNLKYRGGHTIRDLKYVNLYVSGDQAWETTDVQQVERSLQAAMQDVHLNNVLRQYFNNQPIHSTALPPHPLVGYTPKRVTRGDIENYFLHLNKLGYLDSFELRNTVFNLLLPPGTILSDNSKPAHTKADNSLASQRTANSTPVTEPVDSTRGLAGYHGSVVPADGKKIYFSVSVFSETTPSGAKNGIPVFSEPWKNVTATVYHQLSEARTDPDVEDALRRSNDLASGRILGWVSDAGHEIADVLSDTSIPLTELIREVPLADGSGFVPVQLLYSNAAGAVEGPISQPHPLRTQQTPW